MEGMEWNGMARMEGGMEWIEWNGRGLVEQWNGINKWTDGRMTGPTRGSGRVDPDHKGTHRIQVRSDGPWSGVGRCADWDGSRHPIRRVAPRVTVAPAATGGRPRFARSQASSCPPCPDLRRRSPVSPQPGPERPPATHPVVVRRWWKRVPRAKGRRDPQPVVELFPSPAPRPVSSSWAGLSIRPWPRRARPADE